MSISDTDCDLHLVLILHLHFCASVLNFTLHEAVAKSARHGQGGKILQASNAKGEAICATRLRLFFCIMMILALKGGEGSCLSLRSVLSCPAESAVCRDLRRRSSFSPVPVSSVPARCMPAYQQSPVFFVFLASMIFSPSFPCRLAEARIIHVWHGPIPPHHHHHPLTSLCCCSPPFLH